MLDLGRASRDGLLVERTGPRGGRAVRKFIPRGRIGNVLIGYSHDEGGRATASLVLRANRWWRPWRSYLSDLGGDNLVKVADALRDGLGMPRVNWPSGKQIEPPRE